MKNYLESIAETAGKIKKEASVAPAPVEKVASEEDVVMKAAQNIVEEMMKVAEDSQVILSDKALAALGLSEAEKKEAEKTEEAKNDEKEEKKEEEKYEEKKAAEVQLAQGYLKQAFALQKEASEAFQEGEILKAAALRVLYQNGALTEADVEKIAALSYEDVIEKK